MGSPMEQMLAERTTRIQQNTEATASLTKHHKEHKSIPYLVRHGWQETQPRRWHGSPSNHQVTLNRLAWLPTKVPKPVVGLPSNNQVSRNRLAWSHTKIPKPLIGPPDLSRPLNVRVAWANLRIPEPLVGPPSLGRLLDVRTAWTDSQAPVRIEWPQLGGCFIARSPDHRELARAGWQAYLSRPLVGSFQGSPGLPGGFWSFIRYLGSLPSVVRDYVGHWHQHINIVPTQVSMITFESAQYLVTRPITANENWVAWTALPISRYKSVTQDGATTLDQMDAASNMCFGINSLGRAYFDDQGADSLDECLMFKDSTNPTLIIQING